MSKPTSLFARLKEKFLPNPLKAEQTEMLRQIFRSALHDGRLTEQEITHINDFFRESELSQEEFNAVRDQTVVEAIETAIADRMMSPTEVSSLRQIAQALSLPDYAMTYLEERIHYFSFLHSLATLPIEQLPATYSSTVNLQRGEIDYFSAFGNMLEERVINRQIVGKSQGVSIRLMKGVSYRVGQSRGQIVSQIGMVPISFGELTVTSKRLVFSGDRKSVNAPYDKIINMELFTDGLRFSVTSRQKPTTIVFNDQTSAEIVGLYISRMLNQ